MPPLSESRRSRSDCLDVEVFFGFKLKPPKPNLLYLVHRVPYPPNRGDRIRSYHLLRFLAERYNVFLACLADEPVSHNTRSTLSELCAEVSIIRLGRRRWLRAGTSLLCGRSLTEGLFYSPQLMKDIDQWSRRINFSSVVVYCSSMAPYLRAPLLSDVPTVVDLVDVDSQKFYDYAKLARFPKRLILSTEGRRVRQLECQLAKRATAITFVSDAEAALFRTVCREGTCYGVPNGVDLDYFSNAHLSCVKPNHCVFLGALDYHANADGLHWFCHHAWSLVRHTFPDATLSIVGRNPGPAILRLAQIPGVSVVGSVFDVRPYLSAATVSLAPLRVARGVQNKVLESMAMSVPVIASPQALVGLDVQSNVHVMSSQSAEDWAFAIQRIFTDPSWRRELSQAGRQYVELHHHWDTCLSKFACLLTEPSRTENQGLQAVNGVRRV